MIQLVVFDLAGTTVYDPDGVGRCFKAALDAAGVPWSADQVNAIMGTPKPLAIATLLELAGRDRSEAHAIHEDFRSRMIAYYRHDPEVVEVSGTTDCFRALKAMGVKVGLDTGFDRPIVDALLERMGWSSDLIDTSVTSDEVARGRPHPDLALEAMKRTGVDSAKNVAKVGDTPSDLGEGTSAGCALVIGVTEGTHSREQLEPHPHTHLVGSVRDVPALIAAYNASPSA